MDYTVPDATFRAILHDIAAALATRPAGAVQHDRATAGPQRSRRLGLKAGRPQRPCPQHRTAAQHALRWALVPGRRPPTRTRGLCCSVRCSAAKRPQLRQEARHHAGRARNAGGQAPPKCERRTADQAKHVQSVGGGEHSGPPTPQREAGRKSGGHADGAAHKALLPDGLREHPLQRGRAGQGPGPGSCTCQGAKQTAHSIRNTLPALLPSGRTTHRGGLPPPRLPHLYRTGDGGRPETPYTMATLRTPRT
jgi:hypothetical protein